MQIMQALVRRGHLSAAGLLKELPGVSQAGLYRQLAELRKGQLILAEESLNEHGRKELVYGLQAGAGSLNPESFMALGHQGRLAVFVRFLSRIQYLFERWSFSAEKDRSDPVSAGVSFREADLWLDQEEFSQFASEYRDLITRYSQHGPDSGRSLRSISLIIMPDVGHPEGGSNEK